MVLRDSPNGPEVLMMRRHGNSSVLGGAHVFPGGKLDPQDVQVDPALLELGELAGSVALASTQGMARATAAQMREHARNLQKRLAPLGARAVDRVVRRAERASGSVLDKRARLKELQDSWNDLLTCVRATRR